MAIETIAEYGEPDPERHEPAAQGQARVRVGAGLQAHATAALRQAIHTVFTAPLPAVADRNWSLAAHSGPQDAGPAQLEGARPGSQDGVELSL